MLNSLIVYNKIKAVTNSEGGARSALMFYCYVQQFGWTAAESFFPRSTFYRLKKIINASGLNMLL